MLATYRERYTRQAALPQIGWHGHDRPAVATVSIKLLARTGVSHLRLVDDDYVELVNLVRQTLLDEQDARTRQRDSE